MNTLRRAIEITISLVSGVFLYIYFTKQKKEKTKTYKVFREVPKNYAYYGNYSIDPNFIYKN
jgi:hypothetical protein